MACDGVCFDRIVDILEVRIARGDYAMTLFPTGHGLAKAMEVSPMTARLDVAIERGNKRPLPLGFAVDVLSPAAMRWVAA